MIETGKKLPDFELLDDAGNTVTSEDLRGHKSILYFYPKDNTPGCTNEAVSFENAREELEKEGYQIIGVSKDSVDSHKRFKEKYLLNFTLLSDPELQLIKAMGVWVEKKMFGKKYFGVARTTFLIDENLKIDKVYPNVKPAGHGEEILKGIRSQQ
ncbi:MAG TPA: thioredoxin-dependent thiol peroxidase [Clostridiaceae bacterium]|nr:thioredoxin-dependent thiol peroxidase [Clostridiaceae bacterium]